MRVLQLVLLTLGLVEAADASARGRGRPVPVVLPPVTVEVIQRGPDPVRVLLSEGTVLPCTSDEDHVLFSGKVGSGQELNTTTQRECVCVQQTFAPFADIDWSNGVVACRPLCGKWRNGCGSHDPTIRVTIGSRR